MLGLSLFLLLGCLGWIVFGTVTAALAGWFKLAARFPDRAEDAAQRFGWLSGRVGVVNMPFLRLEVCPSGLRVGVARIAGPFIRDFFVPWDQLGVDRARLAGTNTRLDFGRPDAVGTLRLAPYIADMVGRAAGAAWPEGVLPPATRATVLRPILMRWVVTTAWMATFFTFTPRLFRAPADVLPLALTILGPAFVLGIGCGFQAWLVLRRMKPRAAV